MPSSKEQFTELFSKDPRRGAEYLGQIAKISVYFGEPKEAAARARLAATFAEQVVDEAHEAAENLPEAGK